MKKLISAKTIQDAYDSGQTRLEVDPKESIVTPQAQTLAGQLGIELLELQKTVTVSYPEYQKIVEQVSAHFAGGKYSRARIEKAVKEVLAGEK